MADNQDGSLGDVLAKALRSAVQLKIVTAIGTPKLKGSVEDATATLPDQVDGAAVTVLNLVEGDIVTVYSRELVTGDLKDVMVLHQASVTKAEEVVKANIQLLKDMLDKGFERIAPPATKAPNPNDGGGQGG